MKITIKNLQKKIPVYPKRIKTAILRALSYKGKRKSGEITVCFVRQRKIRQLNAQYHAKDIPTDVLTFDISDKFKPDILLADIIISVDAARLNAKTYDTSTDHELNLYAIHGILHLLGYNDGTKKERSVMRKKEEFFIKSLSPNI